MEEEKETKDFIFPPPLLKVKTKIPRISLVWERGKGFHIERDKFTFTFPPPLICIKGKAKVKEN